MDIKELAEKYGLSKDDFWQHKQSGSWIIKHDTSERIAVIENIELVDIKCLTSEQDLVRFLVTMKKGEKQITSVGEASPNNCTSRYYGCMAEKRGIDRCVLKLIEAYEYGVYSEVEADGFKKENNEVTVEGPTDYQKNYIRKTLSNYKLYDKAIVESGLQIISKKELSQYIASFKQDDESVVIGNIEAFITKLKSILKIKETK
tara:strand:- start:2589 stop:3197 length:609 start_codon:yes stop_codon:yes gene_type:complete